MNVVSLVPSVTETLAAWGCPPIACTRYCERPDLPHVGGTKNPDVAAIVALDPDAVVVDRQENRGEDAEALEVAGLTVVVLDVCSIAGLPEQLDHLATEIGATPAAVDIPACEPLGLRAFVPIWRRPWMTIGSRTYGSSVLAALGIDNVFAEADTDYPQLDLEQAAACAPDVVLVPSEPYGFSDAHLEELAAVAAPVRVDGQDLFWWGARTPAALARLHRQLRRLV